MEEKNEGIKTVELNGNKYALIEADGVTYSVHKTAPGEMKTILAPYVMAGESDDEEYRKRRDEFYQKYREEHRCCPNCGSRNYTMTLLGIPLNLDKADEYRDINSCHCQDCGWRGIRHDLVPEKK